MTLLWSDHLALKFMQGEDAARTLWIIGMFTKVSTQVETLDQSTSTAY